MKRIVSGMFLMLLLIAMFSLALNIKSTKAEWTGTVYIRADGSIDPPDAPIITYDKITYTLTGNIASTADGIVVERDDIVIDGAGYVVEGMGSLYYKDLYGPDDKGVYIYRRNNVAVRNVQVRNFYYGIFLFDSQNCIVSDNFLANNCFGVFAYVLEGVVISKNLINNNVDGGVLISGSLNSIVSQNNITGNGVFGGLWIGQSDGNIISGNIFVNSGLGLEGSFNNIIVNNTVNGRPLIYIENNSNITIGEAGQVILINCTNILVKNLELSNTYVGIYLWNTTNATIVENKINNNYIGVYLVHSFSNVISKNNITNNERCGVLLRASNNNIINQNIFVDDGLHVEASYGNIVYDNMVNDKPLVYLEGVEDVVIEGEVGQIILVGCNRITVKNLNIFNTSVGIQLINTYNSIISNNNLVTKFRGIFLCQSINNLISQNKITTYLSHSSGIVLIYATTGNIITRNSITNTVNGGIGVLTGYSNNNLISENNITNNAIGIEIAYSDNIEVVSNNVVNNGYGVYIGHASANTFYHNNFINNTFQVRVEYGSNNNFDGGYPSGGNYWSDYRGEDLYRGPFQNETGNDGIGDTPYVINENNTDRYPLMGPFGGLTFEGQNVTAYPSSEVCLIFENVTREGITSVNVTSIGPEPPSGFKVSENYYDIKTTANYTGTIKLRIIYDDSNMTLEEETNLRLMQWDNVLQQWVDITTFIDIENNIVFGETTHLSIFATFIKESHNTAVLGINPLKSVIGEGYTLNINVIVTNKGNCIETFNLTLYANTTVIETKQITLINGASTTLTFTWNTTGFAKGNYTIWAYAWPVQGETETIDNTSTDVIVYVRIPGDLNADTYVNVKDAVILGAAFGSKPGDSNWNPNADINSDNIINVKDAVIQGVHFGQHDP
jgi:parallel beta-helix repeat protein